MLKIRFRQYLLLLLLTILCILFGYHVKTILLRALNEEGFIRAELNPEWPLMLGCIAIIVFLIAVSMNWYNRCDLERKRLNANRLPEEQRPLPVSAIPALWVHQVAYVAFLVMSVSCAWDFTYALLGKGNLLPNTKITEEPLDFVVVAAQVAFLVWTMRSFFMEMRDKKNILREKKN